MKEIARLANVSVSTVSRVLNSPDNSFASHEVRERIWQIVRESNYVPNVSAKKLRSPDKHLSGGSSRTLACVFARAKTPAENPFFAQISRAVEQQALQMGYVVVFSYSIFDISDSAIIKAISTTSVDGAVVLGRFSKDIRAYFEQHYKNIVYVGLNSVEANWDQVVCDGHESALLTLRHLASLGHERIAYVGETEQEVRFTAYKSFMAASKTGFLPALVSNCPLSGAGGYAGAKTLLEKPGPMPTAVFCANDITAIGAVRGFREAGYRIPEQLSVVSIDNIEMAQYVSPMLTTVEVPKDELGKTAIRVLVDRIEKGHKLPAKILLPPRLIIRESSGPVPKPDREKGGH